MDFSSLAQSRSTTVLQKYLGKGEYPSFQSVAMFESCFVQVTRRGRHVFIHNHSNETIIGIASTNIKLPLPNLMFIARPVSNQTSSGSPTEELKLTRLLPLKFVRISIYNSKKQLIKIKLINGRSYYLQFQASTMEEESLFERWLSLVYLLHHPPSCYLRTQPTSCTILDSLSIKVIPSEEETEDVEDSLPPKKKQEEPEQKQKQKQARKEPQQKQKEPEQKKKQAWKEPQQKQKEPKQKQKAPEQKKKQARKEPKQKQKQKEPDLETAVQLPDAVRMFRQSWMSYEEYTEYEKQKLKEQPKMTVSEIRAKLAEDSFETYEGSTATARRSRQLSVETVVTSPPPSRSGSSSSSSSHPPLSSEYSGSLKFPLQNWLSNLPGVRKCLRPWIRLLCRRLSQCVDPRGFLMSSGR